MQALLPHSGAVTRATHVRSTLLQTSLRMVKLQGHYERWLAHVDPEHVRTIVESVAPSWLPIEVGLAHYLACDQLGLDDAQLERIGTGVGEQLQSTLLNVATRLLRSAGISPELAARSFAKLWPRLCQGGSLQISKVGDKNMSIELRCAVLPRSRYFRGTCVGNVRAALKLVGAHPQQLKALPYEEHADRFVIHVALA